MNIYYGFQYKLPVAYKIENIYNRIIDFLQKENVPYDGILFDIEFYEIAGKKLSRKKQNLLNHENLNKYVTTSTIQNGVKKIHFNNRCDQMIN